MSSPLVSRKNDAFLHGIFRPDLLTPAGSASGGASVTFDLSIFAGKPAGQKQPCSSPFLFLHAYGRRLR
jgi:hypothetical protein